MHHGGSSECRCSILQSREEKLLDDEGRVQVRLICNRCGSVLDSEVIHTVGSGPENSRRRHKAEKEAAEAANIAKGSGVPNKEKVGTVTSAQIEEIVKMKSADLNATDVENAKRMIEGTARSMGLETEGAD